MATIRQRDDRWQAIIKRKGYPLQTKTFNQKKDAEKWARQQERLMDIGDWIDQSAVQQTTLMQLLDRYAETISTNKRGHQAEAYRIGQFKQQDLAKYSLSAITAQTIASWRDARLKEVSSGTVLRELQLLGHVFSVAIREWAIPLPANPVSLIRKPRAGKPRDRILTPAQRDALVMSCGQCQNPWIKPVVVFALETAARRGEILALKWKDVDLQHKIAALKVTKTDQPRTVPLSPSCVSMLASLPRGVGGSVFPVSIEALKQAYERAVIRAGIHDFTFHDLRHDALTRLAGHGFSVLELRAISGHATANMLQRYVSIDARDLARKLASTIAT